MQLFHNLFELFFKGTYKIVSVNEKTLFFECKAVSKNIIIPSEDKVMQVYQEIEDGTDLVTIDIKLDDMEPIILDPNNIISFFTSVALIKFNYSVNGFI